MRTEVGELLGAGAGVGVEVVMTMGVLLVIDVNVGVEDGESVGVEVGGEEAEGVPATPMEDITSPSGKEKRLVVVLQHPG